MLNFPKTCATCGAPFSIMHECKPRERDVSHLSLASPDDHFQQGPAALIRMSKRSAELLARAALATANNNADFNVEECGELESLAAMLTDLVEEDGPGEPLATFKGPLNDFLL